MTFVYQYTGDYTKNQFGSPEKDYSIVKKFKTIQEIPELERIQFQFMIENNLHHTNLGSHHFMVTK